MKEKERDDNDTEGVITTVKNSTESIPLDVTIEILQRLPAKAILKFTSVAKTWYSEIRSKQFVDNFVSMSRPCLLLAFQLRRDNEKQFLFFSSPHLSQESTDSSSSSIVAKHEMTLTVSKTSLVGYYTIHSGSVRGFICISHHLQFMVCNPTTRQIINLPLKHEFIPGTTKCYMHLGYDPTTDHYKVLCIITEPKGHFASEHSVYTLGCRQSSSFPWRRVESGIVNYIPSPRGVYINGVVYYEIRLRQGIMFAIVASFDFCSESLGQLKTPEWLSYLTKYQGKLAGLSFLADKSFNLWVLEDVKEQTWSKIFTFSYSILGQGATFSGITDAGELVFGEYSGFDDVNVFYIDIDRETVRRVKLVGLPTHDEVTGRKNYLGYRFMSCDHVENIKMINLN